MVFTRDVATGIDATEPTNKSFVGSLGKGWSWGFKRVEKLIRCQFMKGTLFMAHTHAASFNIWVVYKSLGESQSCWNFEVQSWVNLKRTLNRTYYLLKVGQFLRS